MSKTRIEQYPNSMLTVGQLLAEEQFKELPINDKVREMNKIEREIFYKNKEKYRDNVDNFLNRLIKVDGYIVELTQYLNISAEEFVDDITREKLNQRINDDMIKRIKEIDELYPPNKKIKELEGEDEFDRIVGAGISKGVKKAIKRKILVGGVISDDDYKDLEKRTVAELKQMLKDRKLPDRIKKESSKTAQYVNKSEAILLLREYQDKQTKEIVGKEKVKEKVKSKVKSVEKEAIKAKEKATNAEQKVEKATAKVKKAEKDAVKAEKDARTAVGEFDKLQNSIDKLRGEIEKEKDERILISKEATLKKILNELKIVKTNTQEKINTAQQLAPLAVADARAEAQKAEAEEAQAQAEVEAQRLQQEQAEVEAQQIFQELEAEPEPEPEEDEEEEPEDEDLKIEDIARDDLEYTFVLTLLTKILDEITNINLEYKTNIINKSKFISLFDIETVLIELKDLRKRWDELASSFRFYPNMPVDKINDRINKEFIKLIDLTKTLDPSFTISTPNQTSLSDSISDRLNSSIISQRLEEAMKRIPVN